MRNALFYGSGVALVTPFSRGKIDLRAFENLIDWQIEMMTDAIIILGTTGEPSTITAPERAALVECAVSTVSGRVPLLVGAGANNTRTAVEYAIEAQALGADGLLVVTPYYNKANRAGLIEHFHAIADSVEIPIIAYNVPSRTGMNMPPEVVAELLKLNREGMSILIVTHDSKVASTCDRIMYLLDGRIRGELKLGKPGNSMEKQREERVNRWLMDMGW